MRPRIRSMLTVAFVAAALAGCSSATGHPGVSSTATANPAGSAATPAPLPDALLAHPAADGDPVWCGPVVSYFARAYETADSSDLPATDGDFSAMASLVTALAGVPGLPADLRQMFADDATLFGRASSPSDFNAGDMALIQRVLNQADSVSKTVTGKCPNTAAVLPELW